MDYSYFYAKEPFNAEQKYVYCLSACTGVDGNYCFILGGHGGACGWFGVRSFVRYGRGTVLSIDIETPSYRHPLKAISVTSKQIIMIAIFERINWQSNVSNL